MYFAALGSSNRQTIEEFLTGLSQYNKNQGLDQEKSYEFERIGEVKFLRRKLSTLTVELTGAEAK